MLFSEQKREEHNTFVNQHWASVTIYGKWQSRCKCMAAASARSMWIFILSHGHPSIHTCSQFKAKHLESSSASPHDRNTHGECVSPPMNSSSSSSSSSPFSESICMASSMKLTAFPSLGAEFWSLPNEASLVSFSLSWVKYCSANSSKSLGWFLNTSTVKLCNSSVSPSGISILIPVISLWMWTKPVCCEFQWFKSTQIRFSSRRVFWLAFFFKDAEISRRVCSQTTRSASPPQRILSFSWMKMALDFWSEHLLLLLARKPTHVTQESMATTYPEIAYEQQRRRNCSQSQNTNDGKEKPWGRLFQS